MLLLYYGECSQGFSTATGKHVGCLYNKIYIRMYVKSNSNDKRLTLHALRKSVRAKLRFYFTNDLVVARRCA